jgi:H+/gluconate symporter-like permease
MAAQSTLETIFKLAGIIVPIITTIITGVIWVVKRIEKGQARIEKGQNKLWKRYRKLSERHTAEMADVTAKLSEKVDIIECERLRRNCPYCYAKEPAVDKK